MSKLTKNILKLKHLRLLSHRLLPSPNENI